MSFNKGDIIKIKKEYQDPGDEGLRFVVLSATEKGRCDIMPLGSDMMIPPMYTVAVCMIENWGAK